MGVHALAKPSTMFDDCRLGVGKLGICSHDGDCLLKMMHVMILIQSQPRVQVDIAEKMGYRHGFKG